MKKWATFLTIPFTNLSSIWMFEVILSSAPVLRFKTQERLLISFSFIFWIFCNWFALKKNLFGSISMALIKIKGVTSILSIGCQWQLVHWLWMSTGAILRICLYSFCWNSLIVVWNKTWSENFFNIFIYIPCTKFVNYNNKIKIPSLTHDTCQLYQFKQILKV